MTLIVGLRGVNKSYLAADSRLTNTATGEYSDDVSKWMNFGKLATCVVAGNAAMAAFICEAVLAIAGIEPSYQDVKTIFDRDLENLAKQFNVTTGKYTSCVIMLAGYRTDAKDSFDMGKIGMAMGASVQKAGGKTVQQSIDPEIIKAMDSVFKDARPEDWAKGGIGRGVRATINRPKSEITAYDVQLDGSGVHIRTAEADTYEALIYGADTATNKLELPAEITSEIFFRDVKGMDMYDVLSLDGVYFVAFINDTIKQRRYTNVGGNIISLFITPELHGFASGQAGMIDPKTGQSIILNDIEVIDGKMHYKDKDGAFMPYRSLLDIKTEAGFSDDLQL